MHPIARSSRLEDSVHSTGHQAGYISRLVLICQIGLESRLGPEFEVDGEKEGKEEGKEEDEEEEEGAQDAPRRQYASRSNRGCSPGAP